MVFERQLVKPIRNWGIFGDIFIFIEEDNPKTVQMLVLRKEQPATIFTLNLNIQGFKTAKLDLNDPKPSSIDR